MSSGPLIQMSPKFYSRNLWNGIASDSIQLKTLQGNCVVLLKTGQQEWHFSKGEKAFKFMTPICFAYGKKTGSLCQLWFTVTGPEENPLALDPGIISIFATNNNRKVMKLPSEHAWLNTFIEISSGAIISSNYNQFS